LHLCHLHQSVAHELNKTEEAVHYLKKKRRNNGEVPNNKCKSELFKLF